MCYPPHGRTSAWLWHTSLSPICSLQILRMGDCEGHLGVRSAEGAGKDYRHRKQTLLFLSYTLVAFQAGVVSRRLPRSPLALAIRAASHLTIYTCSISFTLALRDRAVPCRAVPCTVGEIEPCHHGTVRRGSHWRL